MIRIISKKKSFASVLVPFHMLIKYTPKSNLRERVCFGSHPNGYSPSQRGRRRDGIQRLCSGDIESDRPAAFSFLGSSTLKLMVWSFLVLGCLNCPRESLPHSYVQRPAIMYSLRGAPRGLSPRGL